MLVAWFFCPERDEFGLTEDQIHGGDGYSRHFPFEHIYRHFRRYRITEGAEEIQMRKIAAYLFGFIEPKGDLKTRSALKAHI